ncbi:sporulation delaying protein family toxin [Staphylococcus capitis]|uniref:sporulation delaying protein family toxin n=1 Tax=Staphylococcus capitis TaxID=29388 RepID=UPI000D1AF3B9|nr:sporulation delaying protein family toxin [Staphylococcus capitis]PTH49769.1 hypothetical protein BU616_10745 [Staphylococcus capitis]
MKVKYLISLLVFILCITAAFIYFPTKNETHASTYSGEQLYRGIMFGQGKVGEKLPKIWEKKVRDSANNDDRNKKIINDSVSYIKKKDPKYFNNLEEASKKGNKKDIEKQLNVGGNYFGEFVEKNNLIDKANNEAQKGFRCAAYPYYAVAVFGAAVAVTHAAAVTAGGAAVAYLAVTTTKTFWNSKPKKGKKGKSRSVSPEDGNQNETQYDFEEVVKYIKVQLS